MKASMRDGERYQGSEMQCRKKHYDGQEEGGGSMYLLAYKNVKGGTNGLPRHLQMAKHMI